MKLNVRAFALTCALIWGLGLPVLTWWVIAFEGLEAAAARTTILSSIYRGYALTPTGSVIGGAWAFFDALIGGLIFAWLYNLLAARLGRAAAGA